MKFIVPRLVMICTADSESGSENLSVSVTLVLPPLASVWLLIVVAVTGATGGRTMRSCRVLLVVQPLAKVAVMGQRNAPETVGVPETTPVLLLNVSPVGRPVMFHEVRVDDVLTTAWYVNAWLYVIGL